MSQQNPRNPDGSPSVTMRWWEVVLALLILFGAPLLAVYAIGQICFGMGQCA